MKKIIPWVAAAVFLISALFLWLVYGDDLMESYYSYQAESALNDGRPDRAVAMFDRQLELRPNDDALRFTLVSLLCDSGIYSRAEYHLVNGIRAASNPLPFIIKLSEIYVAQDKLYDAEEMLSGTGGPFSGTGMDVERPGKPVLSPPPGEYGEPVEVTVEVPEGYSCYISWGGDVPSVERDLYEGPVELPPGFTLFRAIMADDRGVVSEWEMGEYRLEGIIFKLEFESPAIEKAARDLLSRPEGNVYSSDLADIERLEIEEPQDYGTLNDLIHMPKLSALSLKGTGACDLSVLPYLGQISELSLQNFAIDTISLEYVGQMTKLVNLDLSGNMISDLSPLGNLTLLETLDLSLNSVINLTALESMVHLRELNLAQNAAQDLRSLSGLSELRRLVLSENRIRTLNGLENLKNLSYLDFGYNFVEYTDPLGGLTGLVELYGGNNSINSLEFFGAMTNLKILSIPSNSLSDGLDGLAGLNALENLDVSDNKLSSLSGLGSCPALTHINADKNNIGSVESLRAHPKLIELKIEQNSLTSLLPLKECPSLKTVYAFGNQISDDINAFSGTNITAYRN